MYKYLFSLLFLGCLSCQMQSSDSSLRLWYKQPAKEWMEATPTGNGRLGAMIYGGTQTETIALNEITMWAGQADENQEIPCGKEKLAEMRQLFFAGKLKVIKWQPNIYRVPPTLSELMYRSVI